MFSLVYRHYPRMHDAVVHLSVNRVCIDAEIHIRRLSGEALHSSYHVYGCRYSSTPRSNTHVNGSSLRKDIAGAPVYRYGDTLVRSRIERMYQLAIIYNLSYNYTDYIERYSIRISREVSYYAPVI